LKEFIPILHNSLIDFIFLYFEKSHKIKPLNLMGIMSIMNIDELTYLSLIFSAQMNFNKSLHFGFNEKRE